MAHQLKLLVVQFRLERFPFFPVPALHVLHLVFKIVDLLLQLPLLVIIKALLRHHLLVLSFKFFCLLH